MAYWSALIGWSAVSIALVAVVFLSRPAHARGAEAPARKLPPAESVTPAIEGMLDAFKTHPLVGLGDAHGMAQELDFYAAVVRHPRFAPEVGNLVVEFGGAAHQDVIDRYVAGELVPYVELRKVWSDTVGWIPMPASLGFMNLFAHVRAANMNLPPDQRIRVWLGEPPIDWSKINTREDLIPFLEKRDIHAAEVIHREVLAKGRKALVIYGGAHFLRAGDSLTESAAAKPGTEAALKRLFPQLAKGTPPYDEMVPPLAQATRAVEATLKTTVSGYGALKSMQFMGVDWMGSDVYDVTFANKKVRAAILFDKNGRIEVWNFRTLDGGVRPRLIDEVEDHHPGAFFIIAPYTGYADKACSERFEAGLASGAQPALVQAKALLRDLAADGCRGEGPLNLADAVLFVGTRAELTMSPMISDLYLDEAYRREIARRHQISTGQPPTDAPQMEYFTASPRKYRP